MLVYFDPKSLQTINYHPKDTFRVYIRRSFGRKKLIAVTQDISLAFEEYYQLAVFKNDMKYIFIKPQSHDMEYKLMSMSGKNPKPRDFRGTKVKQKFETIGLSCVKLPRACNELLKEQVKSHLNENKTPLKVHRLLPILACFFSSLEQTAQTAIIEEGIKQYTKFKIKSGAVIGEDVVRIIEGKTNKDDDLL